MSALQLANDGPEVIEIMLALNMTCALWNLRTIYISIRRRYWYALVLSLLSGAACAWFSFHMWSKCL